MMNLIGKTIAQVVILREETAAYDQAVEITFTDGEKVFITANQANSMGSILIQSPEEIARQIEWFENELI